MTFKTRNHSLPVFLASFAASAAFADPAPSATTAADESKFSFDAGADLRVRHEEYRNVPGTPGGGGLTATRGEVKAPDNYLQVRSRVWTRFTLDKISLFTRIANEWRYHFIDNGTPWKKQGYRRPDEVFLDNLYLEGKGLYDGFLDFKVGRQDLKGSGLGLDRLLSEGTPYDGVRSVYADMGWVRLHPTETGTLDAIAIYDNARENLRYGTKQSRGRPRNGIQTSDAPEMDEWGTGLIWSDTTADKSLAYKVYTIYKGSSTYHDRYGNKYPVKHLVTPGFKVQASVTDWLGLEAEGAKQFGRKGHTQAGGFLGYFGAEIHPYGREGTDKQKLHAWHPFVKGSILYLSGDKHRLSNRDNDTAWDPLFARDTGEAAILKRGTLVGVGYWENLIYPKLAFGADFGKKNTLTLSTGPLFAAVADGVGRADGAEHHYKGWLSSACYTFPIRLAPKKATGWDRFEVIGALTAQLFNPGDYYDSTRPASLLRWEIRVKF